MEKSLQTYDEEPTSGHELYLRHILLLYKAAPLALKGLVGKKVKDRNGNLADLINGKKETFKNSYRGEYKQLFTDDKVNDNIDSWNVRLLCVVILVLFDFEAASAEFQTVKCILDQVKDMDNYVKSASLKYKTFKTKWNSLHGYIIELIEDIDGKYKFECERMIHSFETESINLSSELIKNLKEAKDVNMHVEIALKNKVDTEHGDQDIHGQKETEKRQSGNSEFIETLQDKFVYIDDSAVLTCKLNTSEEQVTWRYNYKQIKESETLKTVKDDHCHWLAISRVKLEDDGLYSCASYNASTTANIRVLDKPPLVVIEKLHVATKEENIKEYMDIDLVCKVNMPTTNATWRHKGVMINSGRHLVSVNDNVYKLTILKAQYQDEGDYTVDFGTAESSTEVKFKGNLNLALRKQLSNDLYKNWIRSTLGLKYLKLGLEDASRYIVEKHHSELLKQLPSIGTTCTQCTIEHLLPAHQQQQCLKKSNCICTKQPKKRKPCPNQGFCSNFFDKVQSDHRFHEPLLANTDIQKWRNDPWSVAKCYISTSGYIDKSTEKEIDCAGLLSLFINNKFFQRSLNQITVNGKTDVFKKARNTRNDILHNANYELSKGQLSDYLDIFICVLEVKDVTGNQPLLSYPGTKEAIDNLNALRKNEIDISIAGDFEKQVQEMREHAMTELAKATEEAAKQNHRKMQHLEEKLMEREKGFQLMRDIRSSQTERKDHLDEQVVFKLDLRLQVIKQTGETSALGNKCIFQSMTDYHSGLRTDEYTAPTYSSVQRLLQNIEVLENCKIADISNAQTAVVVTINCSTCEAIDVSLKMINRNEFEKEIRELRKCLEMNEHLHVYDVTACCSSESLNNTRQSMPAQTQLKDFTCEKHILECTWYCSNHDKFFCPTCKDVDHGECIELEQVISDRSYRTQSQCLVLEDEIGTYNARIKNRLTNRSNNDTSDCNITSVRILPHGEILLVDLSNNKLKKMDRTYKVVSHCEFPKHPWDVCYTGNDMAAVSLGSFGIQCVNVSGNMKCEQKVELDHKCIFLAYHDETLFVGDYKTIYRYSKDFKQKHVLYNCSDSVIVFNHIAVSDDGERIYMANGQKGIITIDKEGNHLSTLTADLAEYLVDVCVVGDGTILVVDKLGFVYQVDYDGEYVLETVIGFASGSYTALCFDRLNCRLLGAKADKNFITVIKLER